MTRLMRLRKTSLFDGQEVRTTLHYSSLLALA